jgi:hypothetical protein
MCGLLAFSWTPSKHLIRGCRKNIRDIAQQAAPFLNVHPHVARQNIELSPIFRDGAARDRNAAVAHILDEHVSLRTRHSSINFAEITLARRTRLFFLDMVPSVEIITHSTMKKVSLALSLA